jgi:hypothetical protein
MPEGRRNIPTTAGGISSPMAGNISFHQLPGAAKDVAVDLDGSIWVIGGTPVNSAGDFGVLRFNGTFFEAVEGLAGVRIAIAPTARPS